MFGFYEEVTGLGLVATFVPLCCIHASLLITGALASMRSEYLGLNVPLQIKSYDYTKPGFQEGTGHFS